MYDFIDLDERAAENALLSIQTIFNGINLDKEMTDDTGSFITLTVGGRGVLPRRFNTVEVPGMHGVRERNYNFDVREIPVKFQLSDSTNEGFRERFERLNGLLLGSQKRLEFTDENAYFTATLESADIPEEETNTIVGTLNFICNDPAKIKGEHTTTVDNDDLGVFIEGQNETPWYLTSTIQSAIDEFGIAMSNGCYILLVYNFIAGDVLEVDYTKRKVTLNGNDLSIAVSLKTTWAALTPGNMSIRTTQAAEISYRETYY